MISWLRRFFAISCLWCLIFLLFSIEAYAYIDPGSGSYLIQLVIAFLLGGLFILTKFWAKILAFIKKLFSGGKKR